MWKKARGTLVPPQANHKVDGGGRPRQDVPGRNGDRKAMKERKIRERAVRALRAEAAPRRQMARAKTMVFRQDWDNYRRIVRNNYLFHREAYATLRKVLEEEVQGPFRFLDIACGDASATVPALAGTAVTHYRGIDLSEPGLALAAKRLRKLNCPYELEAGDFTGALRRRDLAADVAWIGLSLHHLHRPAKRLLMRRARRVVGETGRLLVYENASPGPESRAAWLRRWDADRPRWRAFGDDEWESMSRHVHARDYPEPHETWLALGSDAGFRRARCLYASPNELFRLYCFEA